MGVSFQIPDWVYRNNTQVFPVVGTRLPRSSQEIHAFLQVIPVSGNRIGHFLVASNTQSNRQFKLSIEPRLT